MQTVRSRLLIPLLGKADASKKKGKKPVRQTMRSRYLRHLFHSDRRAK
jgi:hypothetical protein